MDASAIPILPNGAHIGPDSIVAAGTLVTEEMKVPPDRYVAYRLDYMP